MFTAATNDARYLWDNQTREIAGKTLFHSWENLAVGDYVFEAYPNRDSLPYIDIYQLQHARTMFRGTLRYPGWCHTMRVLVDTGFLNQSKQTFGEKTFADLTLKLAGKSEENPAQAIAMKAGLDVSDPAIMTMKWLGLFSDDPLFEKAPTILDQFAMKCLEKMQYGPEERDMVVLHHIFQAEYEGTAKAITSTLIDYGIPGGYSAMARTVSLPVAIGARLIIDDKIHLKGVHIPVAQEIYEPILAELETMNIRCFEEGL